jgi:phytoene dehydrogenase-like protein
VRWDAVVVGAGPNGLAAAVTLAREGWRVLVREGAATVGGAARTAELTLPGFRHDLCSAVHPLAVGSPLLRRLPLAAHGLRWVHPPAPLAHPLDDGDAVLLERDIGATADGLGGDGAAWRALLGPFAARFEALADEVLGAMVHLPRHPLLLARFGLAGLLPATALARARFRGARARALFAGLAAHAAAPLEAAPTAAFGLVLGAAAHAVGWPSPEGGAQAIPDGLAALLRALGGEIETGAPVASLADLPPSRATLLDLTPRQVLRVAGDRLPPGYRRRLAAFRYGPGVFKVDWALAAPIPWRAPGCARAGTVHLGGTHEEIAASLATVARGEAAARPFVLLGQQSPFDASRAPPGRHTAWAYCHVPHGFAGDASEAIEAQVERFAPGFRALVLARAGRGPAALERENPNLVGGDVGAGANTLAQTAFRPVARAVPWATPAPGLYLCSASTPPGGGVHGMCGYGAARAALRRTR